MPGRREIDPGAIDLSPSGLEDLKALGKSMQLDPHLGQQPIGIGFNERQAFFV